MKKKKKQITTYDEYWTRAFKQELFGMFFVIVVVVLAVMGLYWLLEHFPYKS